MTVHKVHKVYKVRKVRKVNKVRKVGDNSKNRPHVDFCGLFFRRIFLLVFLHGR